MDSGETVPVTGTDPDDLGVVDEGGVAVENGRIVEVASSQLLERRYSARQYVKANGGLILPGFVDPHTHLVFKGSRENEFESRLNGATYLDILRKGGGIMETVRMTREATEDELFTTAQARLNTAIESGTTAIEIKSGYGLTSPEELKILKIIGELKRQNPCHIFPTFLGAHAIPSDSTELEYTKLIVDEMLPIVSQRKLADFCDVFCEDGAFSKNASKTILRAGLKGGLRPKIHADQFTDNGGARLANDLGAVSADHLVHSNTHDLKAMNTTTVTPVVLPASSHSLLSSQYAPAKEMISYGLPVALGSDFSPSNLVLGPLTVAAIAARTLRMKSDELIRGITLNAARALGRHKEIGSLRAGKSADIVVLKIPNHKWIGYTYGEGVVDNVLIAGKQVVNNGRRLK